MDCGETADNDKENKNNLNEIDVIEDDEGFLPTEKMGRSTFTVDLLETVQHSCKTIIFTDGTAASAYGKDHLLSSNAKHVGKVEKHVQEDVSDTELWGLRDKKPVPSFLYEINEETLLCICSFNLLPEDISAFSSSIINTFMKKITVLVLQTCPLSNFKKNDYLDYQPDSCQVRELRTSLFLHSLKLEKLEHPNISAGIGAGILTMCEILKIPAASCMVYSSSLDLDESIVKSFSSFLNSYDRQLLGKGNKFASFSSANKGCTGNLYI